MSKPERVFKMGAVRASVFRNVVVQNGQNVPLPKVVIEVRYRDKTGEWKGTNSLSINDLPKAISALQQAYNYLLSGEANANAGQEEGDGEADPVPVQRSAATHRPVVGWGPRR